MNWLIEQIRDSWDRMLWICEQVGGCLIFVLVVGGTAGAVVGAISLVCHFIAWVFK